MYRVRHGRKRWRTRWPWSWLFPLHVDDRFCRTCGLLYHNGPLPKEIKQITHNNVGALIYPAGNWSRIAYVVRFGRWKSGSRELVLSDYIGIEELDDLDKVIAQARVFIDERREARAARR